MKLRCIPELLLSPPPFSFSVPSGNTEYLCITQYCVKSQGYKMNYDKVLGLKIIVWGKRDSYVKVQIANCNPA